ncbi:hypothetical protein [Paenibacillus amylolyticus]|uniref:hypothetical protein n=1 Tax=Paenibacillus amylolyticus TaxID=1451 RepID=UPI00249AC586|nr:hypothetical protein [Paenibacillus amylolyticus]WFA84704.1 hypothetical protein OGI70_27875 [Paenibacillus amylolyticus]
MFTKVIAIGSALLAVTVTYALFRRKRVSPILLHELADRYSEGSDKVILDEMERGELTFISGRLIFDYVLDSRKIAVKTEFYFQNIKGEWIKKMHEEVLSSRVLTKEAISELADVQRVVFEIEAPKKTAPIVAY